MQGAGEGRGGGACEEGYACCRKSWRKHAARSSERRNGRVGVCRMLQDTREGPERGMEGSSGALRCIVGVNGGSIHMKSAKSRE